MSINKKRKTNTLQQMKTSREANTHMERLPNELEGKFTIEPYLHQVLMFLH